MKSFFNPGWLRVLKLYFLIGYRHPPEIPYPRYALLCWRDGVGPRRIVAGGLGVFARHVVDQVRRQRGEVRELLDWLLFGMRAARVIGVRQPRLLALAVTMAAPWKKENTRATAAGLLQMLAGRQGLERQKIIDALAGVYQSILPFGLIGRHKLKTYAFRFKCRAQGIIRRVRHYRQERGVSWPVIGVLALYSLPYALLEALFAGVMAFSRAVDKLQNWLGQRDHNGVFNSFTFLYRFDQAETEYLRFVGRALRTMVAWGAAACLLCLLAIVAPGLFAPAVELARQFAGYAAACLHR